MISLVKNELIKIFHKKGLYILGIILIIIIALNLFITLGYEDDLVNGMNELYYESLENGIEAYDLEDTEDINWYIQDKTELEVYNLLSKYDYESPEYYFIDINGRVIIEDMLIAQYMTKTDEEIARTQVDYDNFLKKLNSYDWHEDIIKERDNLLVQKEQLEEKLKEGDDTSLEHELENVNFQLEGYKYRLDNDIAPSYTGKSELIDTYVSNAIEFASLKKDESSYSERSELINKRKVEETYYTSKYKLDNKIFNEGYDNTQAQVISLFSGVDIFILIALFIIAGGIIAEEFNKGTIKQLLVRPHSRVKILASKVIAGLIAILVFSIFYFLINFISFGILYGEIGSIFQSVIVYDFSNETVRELSTFYYCFSYWLATLPVFIILYLFAIFMGVLTLNTTGTIVSGFGLYFASSIISGVLPSKIVAFLPTSCWDFRSYLFGGISTNQYASFGLSVGICLLTILILIMLTVWLFKRLDVKNQ